MKIDAAGGVSGFLLAAICVVLGSGCAGQSRIAAGLSAEKNSAAAPTLKGERPIVIGHRGASGYLPEHTLAAYELAIDLGADFIEPDLVATKDGELVARHENEISGTTDVAAVFPERRAEKIIDGKKVAGWFTEDLTLAEVRRLRARERLPKRSQAENGKHAVPTLTEVLALVRRKENELGRKIGIYPETKHPSYFRALGLGLEPKLLKVLSDSGFRAGVDAVFIQSFEVTNLRWLKANSAFPLVQLIGYPDESPFDLAGGAEKTTYGEMTTDAGLNKVAAYAAGVGPEKRYIVPVSLTGGVGTPTDFVSRAHAAGLAVHPYTFRSDTDFLAAGYAGDALAEYQLFYRLGVDGVFSDFPDVALSARKTVFPARR